MLVSQKIDAALAGILGLLVGSFLNVVIYRLPKMLERQWAAECASLRTDGGAPSSHERFDLMMPRSSCPHCGHVIRWFENIPVLSYLCLRGRCSACNNAISLRYPLVELATAGLFVWCFWHMPGPWAALAWCGFSAALIALGLIDWDTTLLPDNLTLPLLWAGLLAASLGWTAVFLRDAFWGAMVGYLALWSVYWLFKLITGKEGMGYGDFKLFAALGAWFGWQALIPMILLASIAGIALGLVLKAFDGLREGGYIPFGPFLVMAGLIAMFFGPDAIFRVVGL